MSNNSPEIKVFISYSHKDADLWKALDAHLSVLKQEGFINVWSDGKINPGQNWDNRIKLEIETADIVLVLISADFLASEYVKKVELKKALELHQKGKIDVVPIILRPCDWQLNKALAQLQALPEQGEPITSKHWDSNDEAFTDVVKGLKRVIKDRKETKRMAEISQSEIIKKGTKKIQIPGGPLLPDVVNYIERPADKQLNELLHYTSAPMFLIIGSIQCGKTSLIDRFLKEAEKEKRNKIIHIGFSRLLTANKNFGAKDIFLCILEKAIEDLSRKKPNDWDLKAECDEPNVTEWAAEKLKAILEEHLEEDKNVFLIIDSIDLLHERLKNQEKTDPLINWLARLRNYQDTVPFNQLTVIASMTILSYSAVSSSPLRTQAANINLPNFGEMEINELLKLMGMKNNNEENARKILDLFGGHPHLSHLAVYQIHSGIKFSVIQQNAFNLMGGYGSYWRRIKRMLEYILEKKTVGIQTGSVYKALISENKSPYESKIISDLFEELYLLGLLEMNQEISCGFIRSALKKEVKQNEKV